MPKSKYPKSLDTSAEIPPVRDNILEVGSDVINSLRSAIFNIERVLGINPQGSVGNTLSERLSKTLDDNGNIKSEALSKANVLSGPIIDSDVSKVAAIQESKLKLNFPTSLLQDEISILNSSLDNALQQLNELSSSLAIHISPASLNRHPGTSISIEAYSSVGDDASAKNIVDGTVQSTIQDIYDAHINYTGSSISSTNNSHSASQIYFNNENIADITENENLQLVIEDVADKAFVSQIEHQDYQHSNGILRTAKLGSATDNNFGNILSEDVQISFSKSSGNSSGISTVTILSTVPLGSFDLERSDLITIFDDNDVDSLYTGVYEIESYTLSGSNLSTINVYGSFGDSSTAATTATISKKLYADGNKTSLLCTIREEASATSAKSIQIANPNAVRVISSGIRPSEINLTNRNINIAVDGGSPYTIDLCDGSNIDQTLDTIVSTINEQCAEQALNFMAYRVDYEGKQSELAIVHNLPDTDGDIHTLTVSSATTNNAIISSGFSSVDGVDVSSLYGTSYYINGKTYSGLNVVMDVSGLLFSASGATITSTISGLDFLEYGIKVGDLVIITNSASDSDNGSYIIDSVTSSQLTISAGQLPSGFVSSSAADTRFRIYSNIVSFDSLVFDQVGSTYGSVLADIFMSEDGALYYDKRIEYTMQLSVSLESLITLVDFTGDIEDQTFTLLIEGNTDFVTLTLDSGDSVEVRGYNNYVWITSGSKNVSLKFMIPSVDDINAKIILTGLDITMQFYGFGGANDKSNLYISRVPFDNYTGRVNGGYNNGRVFSILQSGNIGIDEINEDAVDKLRNIPIRDLRSNGVIYGLEVTNVTSTSNMYTFDISRGVCYVGGKRIEVEEKTALVTDVDITLHDKIYIAIDEYGSVVFDNCVPITCNSAISASSSCIIHSIEYNGLSFFDIDMRLFINDLDLKLLNSITVSPQNGMGHFSDIGDALKYARRFSEMFPNAGVPTVHLKSGTYIIDVPIDRSGITYATWNALSFSDKITEVCDAYFQRGLLIDFPLNIVGEGDSSIVKITNSYTFSDVSYTFRGFLAIPGSGFSSFTSPISTISSGFLTFRDFKMENCRFFIPDFNINVGFASLMLGIDIDNIIFDMTGFSTNPYDTSLGQRVIELIEVDDTSTNKGSLSVRNCKFLLPSSASTEPIIVFSSSSRVKNLNISFNSIIGGVIGGSSLFSHDIVTNSGADFGSNIQIFGNAAYSSFDTDEALRLDMVDGATGWGDRVGRDLYIGGKLYATGNADIGGSASADDYSYNAVKTITKSVYADSLTASTIDYTDTNYVGFSNIVIGSLTWRTLLFTNAGVGTEYAIVRIELKPGQKLTSVSIYSSCTILGSGSSMSLGVFSHNNNGIRTTYSAVAAGGYATSGNFILTTFSYSIVGATGEHYYLKIQKSAAAGLDQHVHFINYNVEVDNVEELVGAV